MKAPRRWPVVGHLPAFVRDKLGFLDACAATAGDVVEVDLGGPRAIHKKAEDVRHVLEVKPGRYTQTPRLTDDEEPDRAPTTPIDRQKRYEDQRQ